MTAHTVRVSKEEEFYPQIAQIFADSKIVFNLCNL